MKRRRMMLLRMTSKEKSYQSTVSHWSSISLILAQMENMSTASETRVSKLMGFPSNRFGGRRPKCLPPRRPSRMQSRLLEALEREFIWLCAGTRVDTESTTRSHKYLEEERHDRVRS